MSSRRTTRSPFGNGRSSSGEEVNGRSRPSGCSYLSNVRAENRSTLCSIMAQLTEETQPSFETTLKSKAVSENCNIKFSCVVTGHPTPQVIWYKDDVQLDRYCGLPKYEIFRNGKSHSLHIYNCTLEDAAIYQASASNNKGIVSCSGVLEVGEMNEFKIHQRYFAKLKQKVQNKHKELEGKENQEPLRTVSPDRTQRKRSMKEAFLSTPSSTEDEISEENCQTVAMETDARLQRAAAEKVEEKPVLITNGKVAAVNGQAVGENANKTGTYMCDSAQNILTTHHPKSPLLKKNIKISNNAKVAKSDTPGEPTSEGKRAADETSSRAVLTVTDSIQSGGDSEEVMEVENILSSSSALDSESKNARKLKKSETESLLFVERPLKVENIHVDVPSQREQLTDSLSATALNGHSVSETEGKQAAKQRKAAGCKVTEEPKQKQIFRIGQTKLQKKATAATQSKVKEGISKKEYVTVMDIEEKSNTSRDASLAHKASVKAPRESKTALPQPQHGQTGDQSRKETGPCQKDASVSRPALLSEVTPAHTKMKRNDAPFSLEPPLNQSIMAAQLPQKTKGDTSTHDIKTPSFNPGPQAAIDKMKQDTRNHSWGSSESHKALFRDLQKAALQKPGGGEKMSKVSPSTQQNQVDKSIRTSKETEIQVITKVEGKKAGKLLVQSDSGVPNEKTKMETESAAVVERTVSENARDAANKDNEVIIVGASSTQTEKSDYTIKTAKETNTVLQSETFNISDPVIPPLRKTPEETNLSEMQIEDFQEIQTPVTKVISIAELLRAQIKALDSPLLHSITTTSAQADFVQEPTSPPAKPCEHVREDDDKCEVEVKKSVCDMKSGTNVEDSPPRNIKEKPMQVYQQLQTDQELIQTQGAPSLEKPVLVQPISDTGTTTETARLHGSAKIYDRRVEDICQETGALGLFSTLPESVIQETGAPLNGTHRKLTAPESTILKHTKDEPVQDKDVGFVQKLSREIELHSKPKKGISEILSDQCKMVGQDTEKSLCPNEQKLPTKTEPTLIAVKENNLQLIQQDSPMIEEFSRTDSSASQTPRASPLLKKRNCASSIPCATAQELASGARPKLLIQKTQPEEASEATSQIDNQTQEKNMSTESTKLSTSPEAISPSLSHRSPVLQPPAEQTSPAERYPPVLSRRKVPPETRAKSPLLSEESHTPKMEKKPANKDKHNPFKAPQVIRKIRSETLADASGHVKLWCQFFNVLSDSMIKWYRNEEEIAQVNRNAGDETQVNLAIVQASFKDSGVYRCTITNEFGTDSTDCLLSGDILTGMSLREDLGVGEEIEMTPMIFSKGVADSGVWGNKFFGRIMMQESHIVDGCSHKVWRAKVIYGLEPVFESGNTCIIKASSPITYGGKGENFLIERNLEIVTQKCKIQNLAREYCKIFSAEARALENFGPSLEVIPVYLMYRPANGVPYATVEADLTGDYRRYSLLDHPGRTQVKTGSDVEQKCCALQHWIFQWTSGNMLLTRLEGVDTKITNVGISIKSTGHQGLPVEANPKVLQHFVSQHCCNYFCGLLGLKSPKVMDSLTPTKPKTSKSPLLQRKMAADSSPQTGRKAAGSPRLEEGRKTPNKHNTTDTPKVVKMK